MEGGKEKSQGCEESPLQWASKDIERVERGENRRELGEVSSSEVDQRRGDEQRCRTTAVNAVELASPFLFRCVKVFAGIQTTQEVNISPHGNWSLLKSENKLRKTIRGKLSGIS